MIKIFKKKYSFAILYTIILIGSTTYVLLDTFVIPKVGVVVKDDEESTTNNTTDDTSSTTTTSSDATITDTSYTDDNISIDITTSEYYDTAVYIVDIQLSSIDYLQTAFANNTYGRNIKATTSTMAEDNNAILAINGDYYGFRDYGYVLRNGTLYRSTANSDEDTEDLVIYEDGTFGIVKESEVDASDLLKDNALQVFSFGPTLVEDGEVVVDTTDEVGQAMTSNPRTAIGIIDSLHYIIIVSDGRTSASAGLTLYELAKIFKEYGCTTAYNLDGGGSSTLWFNGEIINNPTDGSTSGERKVSDIVYIGY